MLAFVMSHGYQWIRFNIRPIPVGDFDLDGLGLPQTARDWADAYHLLGGENPDGLGHMCVGRGGVVVHDPNPSRRGLATIEEIILFAPLAEVEEKWVHWLMRDYACTPEGWALTTENES